MKNGKCPRIGGAYAHKEDAVILVLALAERNPSLFSDRKPLDLSITQWVEVPERSSVIMASPRLSHDDSLLARLFLETPPPAHPDPWYKATAEDRMRKKRNRCQLFLSELVRWSRKAIPSDGGVRIVL